MSFQNVFILGGTGLVGTELIRQISQFDGSNHGHKNPTVIAGIANSTQFILSPGGITVPETINQRTMRDHLTSEIGTSYKQYEEILEAVGKSGMDGDIIFVDVTADGEKMVKMHKSILAHTGNRIVTANKKPAAADMQTFREITGNPHRYRYNTTVMAGAGAVPYFQEAHGLSEEIISVEGTFSGTLAYVCSELQKGEKPLSLIVREAQEKGYTEPHPIDDLGGEDVRRKLLILLRSAGISIEEDEVNLRGLIDPRKYNSMDPQAFLNSITQEDADMRARVEGARKNGLVPRYVGSFKDGLAQVGLQFVPIDSDLGSLQGTANKVLIHTSQRTPEGSAPHVIQSPGAGVIKTAAAVRADLLYLLSGTNLWQHT